MSGRTRFDAAIDKRNALTAAEKAGEVADSRDVRMSLIKRMKNGELTLPDVQRELERIKRDAKKNGKLTRSQVWSKS